jgi:hypothetical protein
MSEQGPSEHIMDLYLANSWPHIHAQIKIGANTIAVADNLPEATLAEIRNRLEQHFERRVNMKHVSDSNLYSFEPVVESGEQMEAKKVPRPANAFILYRTWHHNAIVAANPGINNNDICKLSINLRLSIY